MQLMEDLTGDQRMFAFCLSDLMSAISERAYCASWMDGLEYSLWFIAQRQDTADYGLTVVTDEEIDRLLWLSQKCGGWISESAVILYTHEEWLNELDGWHTEIDYYTSDNGEGYYDIKI